MAAGNTYVAIAEQTLGTDAASVTFSSIPGTYTDLIMVVNAITSTASEYMSINLNSDTGSNYSRTNLAGNGTSAVSVRGSNETVGYIGAETYGTNALKFNTVVHFMNYANTTTYKTFLSRANHVDLAAEAIVGLWRSTSAITTIKVNSNFATGSTFSLYGIAAA
jgi:hypothetical protein